MAGNQRARGPPPGYSDSNDQGYPDPTTQADSYTNDQGHPYPNSQSHQSFDSSTTNQAHSRPQAGQEAGSTPHTTTQPYEPYNMMADIPIEMSPAMLADFKEWQATQNLPQQDDQYWAASPAAPSNQPYQVSNSLYNDSEFGQPGGGSILSGSRSVNSFTPQPRTFADQHPYENRSHTSNATVSAPVVENGISLSQLPTSAGPREGGQHAARALNSSRRHSDGSLLYSQAATPAGAGPGYYNDYRRSSEHELTPRRDKRSLDADEASEMNSTPPSLTQRLTSAKRPRASSARAALTLTPTKTKRPKLDLRTFAPVKSSNVAANTIRGTVATDGTIQSAPAYVNEATTLQAAKDRLDRTSPSIKYHQLSIGLDDRNAINHRELMPKLCQRFFHAILKDPGTPPSYITASDLEDFNKKHQDNFKACKELMSSEELKLDAKARIELLVAATMRFTTNGIPIADLKASEYNKTGGKQKIMTWGDFLVDTESTFLERLDRMIQYCEICKLMALDILEGLNTRDIVAAPDLYAKRKFTNYNSNGGRNSRKKDCDEALAKVAELQGAGGVV